ncbi:MAG: hypothetical protein ACOY3Y_15890, partial [Acidobacteriota bacterium]
RAAAAGAYMNVCINLPGLADKDRGRALVSRADAAWQATLERHARAEAAILASLRAAAIP